MIDTDGQNPNDWTEDKNFLKKRSWVLFLLLFCAFWGTQVPSCNKWLVKDYPLLGFFIKVQDKTPFYGVHCVINTKSIDTTLVKSNVTNLQGFAAFEVALEEAHKRIWKQIPRRKYKKGTELRIKIEGSAMIVELEYGNGGKKTRIHGGMISSACNIEITSKKRGSPYITGLDDEYDEECKDVLYWNLAWVITHLEEKGVEMPRFTYK